MNAAHDHTVFQAEVEQRWGKNSYAAGDAWWRSMTDAQREAWQADQRQLAADWQAAAAAGEDPAGAIAQDLAARHVAWLSNIPGTPGYGQGGATDDYVLGLADMYVADERFAANYGGAAGAEFVRASLRSLLAVV